MYNLRQSSKLILKNFLEYLKFKVSNKMSRDLLPYNGEACDNTRSVIKPRRDPDIIIRIFALESIVSQDF